MPRQAERAEQAINHERGPSKVTRLLEQRNKKEKQDDLRQKNHRPPHARDDAIGQQVSDRASGENIGDA